MKSPLHHAHWEKNHKATVSHTEFMGAHAGYPHLPATPWTGEFNLSKEVGLIFLPLQFTKIT